MIASERDVITSGEFGGRRGSHRPTTTAADPGTLPSNSRPTIAQSTRRLKPKEAVATSFVVAENRRSVPTATEGDCPNASINIGVIIDPPPTPVRPTMVPTRNPAPA